MRAEPITTGKWLGAAKAMLLRHSDDNIVILKKGIVRIIKGCATLTTE